MMLNTIAKIFGKSPFAPLQLHIERVALCMEKLTLLIEALAENDLELISSIAKEVFKLEHQADLTKNDIRNHLPSTLFMPIDRATLLDILSLQDAFADQAEDISVLVTIKPLANYDLFQKPFEDFFKKNIETFFLARNVIHEFDNLLETSFGGAEANKVKEMIENLAENEHQIDQIQYDLVRLLYNQTDIKAYTDFHLWLTLIKEVGMISNLSEKLGNKIRMILEIK